ncbi:hypothetical protein BDW66DRAFT_144950 [Aspergillus desertorum]
MFIQSFDHFPNDLFNQYVDMDTFSADANKDVSFPSEFDQVFPLDSFSTECGDQSPVIPTAQHTSQSVQDWAKDLWSLSQNTACSTDQDNLSFQDSAQPPAAVDLNISLGDAAAGQSRASAPRSTLSTPPATPGPRVKGGLLAAKAIRRHRDSNDRRGLLRKQSFSPGLMGSSQLQKGSCMIAYPDAWTQRLQGFTIRSSDECLPLSPPPSDILVQQETIPKHTPAQMINTAESFQGSTELKQFDSGYISQSSAMPMPSASANVLTSQQQRYLSQANTSALTPSPPPAGDMFSSPHSSDPQPMSSWHSDSLSIPAFQYTPEFSDQQTWWSPMPSEVAQRHASYQQMIVSPAPQRPIQASANHGDLLQGGLMIHLDPTQLDISPSFPSSTIPTTTNSHDTFTYDLEAHATRKYVDASSFTTASIRNPSRSSSISPKTETSPKNDAVVRDGMIMRNIPRRPHGRKLFGQSTGTLKPVKAPSSLSTSAKGAKSVTVSFVNFTANDSQKILTGVAPSGSSKTKARREQEARDRRRKLSEAALQAVRKAGGDVEALEAVLC